MHRVNHKIDSVFQTQTFFCLAFYIALFAPIFTECISSFACNAILAFEDPSSCRLCRHFLGGIGQCLFEMLLSGIFRVKKQIQPSGRFKLCRKVGRRRHKSVRFFKCRKRITCWILAVMMARMHALCKLLQMSIYMIACTLSQSFAYEILSFIDANGLGSSYVMSGFEDGFCLKRQETSSCMRCLETEPHRRWQRGQVAEKGRARANGKLQMLTLQLHIRHEFQQMHHIFIRILTPKFAMQFKWFCRKRRVFERRLAWCHVSGVSLSNTNRACLNKVVSL